MVEAHVRIDEDLFSQHTNRFEGQLSLSYDDGATFSVIKSMIGGCPLSSTYDFTVPSYAPEGQALFAWTWQNYEGNREFYMNCAEVQIANPASKRRRQTSGQFSTLPYIWKANLEGVNNCTTVANENPVYPHPGSDVEYGGNMTSSSPVTTGDCDESLPYGQTYRADNNGTDGATPVYPYGNQTTYGNSTSAMTGPGYVTVLATPSSYGPQTVFVTATTCFSDITVTAYTNSPTATSTWTTYTISSAPPPSSSTTASSASPAPSNGADYVQNEDYANDNYLPCVPGTFICSSPTEFLTCDYNDGSDPNASAAYIYDYPRVVAAGMQCVPFLSPYSSDTNQYAQQANAASGYYRDDKYARSQSDGTCSEEGALQCESGGSDFWMCDQGAWIDMGSVAAGTTCEDGQIVAS